MVTRPGLPLGVNEDCSPIAISSSGMFQTIFKLWKRYKAILHI